MRVYEVMTPGAIGVTESATLWEAVATMLRSHVSALIVFDKLGAPIGVLSEGDLLRRSELGTQKRRPQWLEFLLGGGRAAENYVRGHGRRVDEVMTRGVIGVEEDADLGEAVDLMLAHRIKRLPALRDGKVVGILARSDLLKALYAALPRPGASASDAEILATLQAAVEDEKWAPRGSVRISVDDGIVTLEGAVTDDRLRDGMRVLAENTPGVTKVHDRLAWIEPNSGYLVPMSDDDGA